MKESNQSYNHPAERYQKQRTWEQKRSQPEPWGQPTRPTATPSPQVQVVDSSQDKSQHFLVRYLEQLKSDLEMSMSTKIRDLFHEEKSRIQANQHAIPQAPFPQTFQGLQMGQQLHQPQMQQPVSHPLNQQTAANNIQIPHVMPNYTTEYPTIASAMPNR